VSFIVCSLIGPANAGWFNIKQRSNGTKTMRQLSRKRKLKLQHKFAHIRRNYYFHMEQKQHESLPPIAEFEKLKALLADRMN
jgi:hypothetical protein